MSRILLSILSDYLQPNFLLIKEMNGRYDELMFITTQGMENKSKRLYLEKALKLKENSVARIIVPEDDYVGIIQKLEDFSFSNENEYIINLTGGTKVIPIAVYEFFKQYNSSYYYVPIGKNCIKKLDEPESIALNYRINLQEYFTLNSMSFVPDKTFIHPESFANNLFDEFKKVKFNRKRHDKILNSQSLDDPNERLYYSGAWFEEYCYYRLKRELGLPDEAICKNAKISRENSSQFDNEIDVMLIHNNQLYVFECKLSMWGMLKDSTGKLIGKPEKTVEEYMYKLAAIAKDYGFHPKSYILTLHNLKYFKQDFTKRIKILELTAMLDCNSLSKSNPILEMKMPSNSSVSENHAKVMKKTEKTTVVHRIRTPKIVGKIDLDAINKGKTSK